MGLFDNLTPEARLMMGAGIMGGQNLGQGLMNGAQMAMPMMLANQQKTEAKAVENKTREWLQKQYPGEDFSTMSPDMMKMYANEAFKSRFAKPEKPDFKTVGDALYNTQTGEWITPPEGVQTNQSEYGLNPQTAVDKDGNPVLIQLSKDGRATQAQLPEGVRLSKEPIRLDAGTHFVLLDPITRQPIGQIPKNVAEVEKQKELGANEGKQLAAAPGDLQAGQNAKELINSIRADPNRTWGTGVTSVFNRVPSSPGYDFQKKVEQAKSGAFLTAIEQMRGLGALSNAEGQTATAAVTRMDTATSEKEFLSALSDYEKIIDQGIARAQKRIPNATSVEDPLGIR